MAITKLDHLKESKKGNPAAHLKNAIRYILNPEKTNEGMFVGGNCGTSAEEIYASMISTKEFFGKTGGRQGYHFVISFSPGEASCEEAFQIGKEFCEQYFSNAYEYVYAVHDDHAHMHCHIVFNSVSQIDGRKYRYTDGDWEKHVQPVTDALCEKHGLEKLVYDRERKKGESYAEHLAKKEGRLSHSDVIRADIDAAVMRSGSYADFISAMRSMGYEIREGASEEHGAYLSYHAPGFARARRDYRLGDGYRALDIRYRIAHKEEEIKNEKEAELFTRHRASVLRLSARSQLQICFVLRVRQATDWHYFAFRKKEQARVRQDLLKIDRLNEECAYLIREDIKSVEEAKEHLLALQASIKKERNRIRGQRAWTKEEESIREAYRLLESSLEDPDLPDEEAEEAMDRIKKMENTYPAVLFQNRGPQKSALLESLLHERKILTGILKEAPVSSEVREVPRLRMAPETEKKKEVNTGGRAAGDHEVYQRLSQGTRDRG